MGKGGAERGGMGKGAGRRLDEVRGGSGMVTVVAPLTPTTHLLPSTSHLPPIAFHLPPTASLRPTHLPPAASRLIKATNLSQLLPSRTSVFQCSQL